jgi:acyl-CoA synthetase (AMP-forming)/AMP-acid ligase II
VITVNIADLVSQWAVKTPDRKAVVAVTGRRAGKPVYEHLTFAELDQRAGRYAAGLHRIGIRKGVRTVLMVKPGLEFFALVFALFRVGATLVLIDPGIDKKALSKCLKEVEAEAFVGVSLAHVARLVLRWFPAKHRRAAHPNHL